MTIVIELPDEVATRIAATGEDVQRFTLRAALAQLQQQETTPDARDDENGGSLYDDLLPFMGKGQTVAELAASLKEQPTETLADALRGRVGQFHSGKGELSQKTGERFATLLTALPGKR